MRQKKQTVLGFVEHAVIGEVSPLKFDVPQRATNSTDQGPHAIGEFIELNELFQHVLAVGTKSIAAPNPLTALRTKARGHRAITNWRLRRDLSGVII